MNESSEKFMASVGLTSADFEISQSVVDRLSENEQNEVLNSERRYLAHLLKDGNARYFQIDKYDSRQSMDTKILIGPASVFDRRGRRHSEYARLIISRDNFSEDNRTLFTDDIILDPVLLGKGVSWNESSAHIDANRGWSCTPNHGPKVMRVKDNSDLRLGPAAVSLHLGSSYEDRYQEFRQLSPARIDQLSFYMGMMTSMHEVPHDNLKLHFY